MDSVARTMYSSPFLDRSPSLSSNSSASGSGASSVASIATPAMAPVSSFPSASYPSSSTIKEESSKTGSSQAFGNLSNSPSYRSSPRSRTESLQMKDSGSVAERPRSPWSAGHRTGAGSASFDSARARFGGEAGLGRTNSIKAGLFSRDDDDRTRSPSRLEPIRTGSTDSPASSPASNATFAFPSASSATPTAAPASPTRRSPLPPTPGSNTPSSPTRRAPGVGSPFGSPSTRGTGSIPFPPSSSPTRSPTRPYTTSMNTPGYSPSAQALSSSIFATRDASSMSPLPSSPASPHDSGRFPSVRRFDSMSSATGRNTHRRAMTLPQNLLHGTPPGVGSGAPPVEDEVAGLPGRARLSRPADAPFSSFAPSKVFESSHGLSSQASSSLGPGAGLPSGSLLPSQTVKAIDRQRQNLVAYEYLCHVRETQEWLDSCITTRADDTPMWGESVGDFEQSLRNGYALAHLARSLGSSPACHAPIYNDPVRHFRHTQNINIFFEFLREVELPRIFVFETVDCYDGKNLPKVIYCLHALSQLLYRRGITQRGMQDLVGQIEFTDAEVSATEKGLDGVRMPNFKGIGKALDKHDAVPAPETDEQRQDRELRAAVPHVIAFQAQARGALARTRYLAMRRQREADERKRRVAEEQQRRVDEERMARHRAEQEAARRVAEEQARQRAVEDERMEQQRYEQAVRDAAGMLVGFQATARGALARRDLLERIRQMRSMDSDGVVTAMQAAIRGQLARRAYANKATHFRRVEVVRSVGGLQSLARAALVRRRVDVQKQELGFVEPDVVGIQAQTRGFVARRSFLEWRDHIYRNEDAILDLQSLVRGHLARRRYFDVLRHFHHNLGMVTRLQAIARSRKQGSQYRRLRMGTNVPASTIKNFIRLLDDSEFDYRGELTVESMRKQLVATIRETQDLEDDVKDLDTKIALLVKNKITHEVARAQRAGAGGLAPLRRDTLLAAAKDPFSSEALDRQSQRRLELYQQLFYQLQTRPEYFARLFANAGRLERHDKAQKALEQITFVVFGYAQAQREEFLLLKLFQRSIQEELVYLPDVGAFVRGNFTFIRLLMQYGRGVSQRKSLQTMLGPQVKAVMSRNGLDLGTDPLAIYRALIAREETRTGVPSARPVDVNYAYAVSDPETNAVFIEHLIALRQATDGMLKVMYASTANLPFGIRFVAREVFRALRAKFSDEPEAEMLRVAGHLVYYRFIQPAIVAPETFDIIEGVVPAIQRQNLAEVAKLLNQISVGRLFGEDQAYLKPMNAFIESSALRFAVWMRDVIYVEDPETHFRADEWLDAKSSRQPIVYISPNDIYATHGAIAESLDFVAPEEADPLRAIIIELGAAPTVANGELGRARADEVPLTLIARLHANGDPEAENKALFNQAKRRVLGILKIHHGADLESVLAQVVTQSDEETWLRLVQEEEEEERRQAHAQRRHVVPQPDDIRRMSFHQLKMAALQDILRLRQTGMVSKSDKYQALLDSIAQDIRSKHHRRVQRQHEIGTMQATLASLRAKKSYLQDQIKSYHVYIDQSMASIQKKSKKRIVLPWSMQGMHQRQLDKSGKSYKYGSYKYSAQNLYDRGVLLSIDQFSPKQFDKISLTVSSNDVGVFEVTAAYIGVPVTTVELKLEDLLESQFVGRQTIEIGDVAKVNLNLLVHLINRKFYA